MTTPSSGQISLGDLKSELNAAGFAAPSADISLFNMNAYDMLDGFYDTYGYNIIISNTNIGLSNFYDLQTECAYDLVLAGSITQYNNFSSTVTNNTSPGGSQGTYYAGNQFFNPASGTLNPPFTNGVNMVHMDQLTAAVSCNNTKFPPGPPYANITITYDTGGGATGFPGSPFNGPVINVNTGNINNAPNSGTIPRLTINCS